MREHWNTCHGIPLDEIMLPMIVPVLIKEHARPNIRELGLGSGPVTLDLVNHLVVSLVQVVMPGLAEGQVTPTTGLAAVTPTMGLAGGPVTLDLVDHLLVPLVQAVMPGLCQTKDRVSVEQEARL